MFPRVRPRRLRRTEAIRSLVRENSLSVNDLIYPIFVEEGIDDYRPIATMPEINRVPERLLGAEVKAIQSDGIKALMLFGVSHKKDAIGSDAFTKGGLLSRMISTVKDAAPDLVVIADACFCDYTDHGHCGVLEDGCVNNDRTIENLAKQAIVAAEAGADVIAPSAMMDGQVGAIRLALDQGGHENVAIMSYSSKFASGFYGPFREALGIDLCGDRKSYQIDPPNMREALREALIDQEEGADFLMVKPGLPYLDVLSKLRERTLLPIVAYQVSGEYAMIKFAAQAGAINERAVVRESLIGLKRAGADLILSYYARKIARDDF